MTQITRIAIALVISAVVIALTVFDRDAGSETRYAPRLEVHNAKRYADWCGGYVQVIPTRHGNDVTVLGCDR
jgi:hypothetical protein